MTRLTATSAFISSSPLRRRHARFRRRDHDLGTGPGRRQGPPRFGPPGSAVGARTPQHVAGAAVVDPPAKDEEIVREAVQVFERLWVDRLAGGPLAGPALGAPPP